MSPFPYMVKYLFNLAGTLADVGGWNWWCIKVEKQEEILIYKYYSYVYILHKVVLDIYWVIVWLKVLSVNSIFEQISIVGDNRVI